MPYLGKSPTQAVRARYYYTASAADTSVSGSDANGNTLIFSDGEFVDVSLNGVSLVAGTDYVTSTANTIGSITAMLANDIVEVVVYDVFSVFDGNVNGRLSVAGQVTVADGTVGAPALSNIGDTNTGLLFSAADTMAFSAGGTSQFTMADGAINPVTDNDIDLGTASLKYKNAFAGLVDAENFKINGAQGSDGQVLTSTGSGVAFEAAAGGATTMVASTILGSAAAAVTVTGFSTTFDVYHLEFDLISVNDGNAVEEVEFYATADNGTKFTDANYQVVNFGTDNDGDGGGTSRQDQNEWRTQTTGMHCANFTSASANTGSDLSPIGHNYMKIMNPKNPNRIFVAEVILFSRSDIETEIITFHYESMAKTDVTVGGISMERVDGGNFAANTRLTLIGYNKS